MGDNNSRNKKYKHFKPLRRHLSDKSVTPFTLLGRIDPALEQNARNHLDASKVFDDEYLTPAITMSMLHSLCMYGYTYKHYSRKRIQLGMYYAFTGSSSTGKTTLVEDMYSTLANQIRIRNFRLAENKAHKKGEKRSLYLEFDATPQALGNILNENGGLLTFATTEQSSVDILIGQDATTKTINAGFSGGEVTQFRITSQIKPYECSLSLILFAQDTLTTLFNERDKTGLCSRFFAFKPTLNNRKKSDIAIDDPASLKAFIKKMLDEQYDRYEENSRWSIDIMNGTLDI